MSFRAAVLFKQWSSKCRSSPDFPRIIWTFRSARRFCFSSRPVAYAVAFGYAYSHINRGGLLCNDTDNDKKAKFELLQAVRRGDVSRTFEIMNGAVGHIDEPLTSSGQTTLSVACGAGALPLVEALLNAGADPNTEDSSKATPLSAACISGSAHVVKKLVERPGIGAEICDVNGLAPIHQAVGFGQPECLRCMLQHGLNPNLRTGEVTAWSSEDKSPVRYETPLHIAARLLTRAINAEDGSGSTEHQQRQRRAIMEVLVSYGADPLAPDAQGDTPLHHCARYGDAPGLWLLFGNTSDALLAAYATNCAGVTVIDEATDANWAAGVVLKFAIQVHAFRIGWRKYWSVYEFIGK